MKRSLIIVAEALLVLAVVAVPTRGNEPPAVETFSWLAGTWVATAGETRTEEQWTSPAGGAMLGLSRTLKDGRQVGFEYLRIVTEDDGVAYVAQPGGRPPTTFRLTRWSAEELAFENREHDFPQVIRYLRRPPDALSTFVEGPGEGGKWRSFETQYERGGTSEPEFLSGPDRNLKLPFSEAVRVGDLLFLSGQIGKVPGTLELATGGIAGETRQTLENVRGVLERHGSSMDRVVKCTVFMADISEWAAMNDVYVTYFPDRPPARSALGANGLAIGARVEIECLAVMDSP